MKSKTNLASSKSIKNPTQSTSIPHSLRAHQPQVQTGPLRLQKTTTPQEKPLVLHVRISRNGPSSKPIKPKNLSLKENHRPCLFRSKPAQTFLTRKQALFLK